MARAQKIPPVPSYFIAIYTVGMRDKSGDLKDKPTAQYAIERTGIEKADGGEGIVWKCGCGGSSSKVCRHLQTLWVTAKSAQRSGPRAAGKFFTHARKLGFAVGRDHVIITSPEAVKLLSGPAAKAKKEGGKVKAPREGDDVAVLWNGRRYKAKVLKVRLGKQGQVTSLTVQWRSGEYSSVKAAEVVGA